MAMWVGAIEPPNSVGGPWLLSGGPPRRLGIEEHSWAYEGQLNEPFHHLRHPGHSSRWRQRAAQSDQPSEEDLSRIRRITEPRTGCRKEARLPGSVQLERRFVAPRSRSRMSDGFLANPTALTKRRIDSGSSSPPSAVVSQPPPVQPGLAVSGSEALSRAHESKKVDSRIWRFKCGT